MTFYEEMERLAKRYPPLKKEELELLAQRAAEGDKEAEELLFKHNAKRVIFFVQEYYDKGKMYRMGRRKKDGLPNLFRPAITRDEVTQAAVQGLRRAIDTFDPDRGRFNNHCNMCIWQAIYRLFQDEQRQQERLELVRELEEEKIKREYCDPEREALAEEFFEFAREVLTEEEFEGLMAALGRTEGKVPRMLELFLEDIAEKLRAKAPEGKWAAWAKALLGD